MTASAVANLGNGYVGCSARLASTRAPAGRATAATSAPSSTGMWPAAAGPSCPCPLRSSPPRPVRAELGRCCDAGGSAHCRAATL